MGCELSMQRSCLRVWETEAGVSAVPAPCPRCARALQKELLLFECVFLCITNPRSGLKSMQDGWCGEDMPLPGSRAPGWEEEEDVEIGMWTGSSSQELHSSLNWPPYTKKMSSKVNVARAEGSTAGPPTGSGVPPRAARTAPGT